ncbi:MAG: hypothetical protein F6K47_40620 [Symploca sp. SIO2E6]|nr:hypothetical protein [Symploca sp. SIO2E6]
MSNFLLLQQRSDEDQETLTRFIESNPEPREQKRALAIKMSLLGETDQLL